MRRALLSSGAGSVLVMGAVLLAACTNPPKPPAGPPPGAGSVLRFFGTGSGGIDRVEIPLNGSTKANVGAGDFTIELWIKGTTAENSASGCGTGNDAWIGGNIVVDRDTYNAGDRGDFGISLFDGQVGFGASSGGAGATVCGSRNVLDGSWHHVAVTRDASSGALRIFVDGQPDGTVGSSPATGDISYRVGRSTPYRADPLLVIGAEKHDAGSAYPSFSGWVDDLRLSSGLRYTGTFNRPGAPLDADAATLALYRFDEGAGTTAGDEGGTSPGTLKVGGPDNGPRWEAGHPG
jgi:hypothetical protein